MPSPQPIQHNIVALDTCHVMPPTFHGFPHTITYCKTTKPDEVFERIKSATIVISIIVPVTPAIAAQCPNLRLIVVMATGHSWVDEDGLRALGVAVVHCPHSNIPAVSEHTLGLYFAVRKRIAELHAVTTQTDEWAMRETLTGRFEYGPPLSCGEECVGIIGYGALGQRIEQLMRGVGMGEVIVAERQGVSTPREGRVSFEEVVKRATVLVICCPKDASTIGLINKTVLAQLRREAVVINMARGGIVNERDLADALFKEQIAGAATDVLEAEPGVRGQSPLLPAHGEPPVPNFVISPHISWFASRSIRTLRLLAKDAVEGYAAGKLIHPVVDPGSLSR